MIQFFEKICSTELKGIDMDSRLYVNFNISVYLSLSLQPTHLANFNQVQSIQYSPLEEKDRKGMLQLNVAGAPEVKAHTHTHTLNSISLTFPL